MDEFKHYDMCIDYSPNNGLFAILIRDPSTDKCIARFGDIRCNSIRKIWGCSEFEVDWSNIKVPHELN